jgi:hypothetical protein
VTFSNNYNWTLSPAKGLRTVTVEFKDTQGKIVANQSSDDINLAAVSGLGGLPDKFTFIYAQNTAKWYPDAYLLSPQNSVSSLPLNWSITTQDSWINLSQTSGTTPSGTSMVSINGLDTTNPGTVSSSLNVQVSPPVDIGPSTKNITVEVMIVPNMDHTNFMPLIGR